MADGDQTIFLMASVKDEGPFVLEFVAHHLVLGFSKIFLASNDCSDGTDDLLGCLDRAGHIHHVQSTVQAGEVPQHIGYAAIRSAHAIDAADWLMVLDVDEFLNVHVGDHSVAALVAAADGADIVALSSATFGARGETQWRRKPVTEMFRYRYPTNHLANAPVKTLTRNPHDFRAIREHCLVGYRGASKRLGVFCGDGGIYVLDLSVPLLKQLRRFPPALVSHNVAQFNHYAAKTYDTFCLRRERGRGAKGKGLANDRHDDAYYLARSGGDELDETIARYRARVRAKMAGMLADAQIFRCQRLVERNYRLRIAPYVGLEPDGR